MESPALRPVRKEKGSEARPFIGFLVFFFSCLRVLPCVGCFLVVGLWFQGRNLEGDEGRHWPQEAQCLMQGWTSDPWLASTC